VTVKAIEQLRLLRAAIVAAVENLPESSLSRIPEGLRNNLHWQAGHVLTVHGSLLYRRCGQPLPFDEAYSTFFGKGTSPADWKGRPPLSSEILERLRESVPLLEADLPDLSDKRYAEPITVSNGFRLASFRRLLD
jgi:hypothetical protein